MLRLADESEERTIAEVTANQTGLSVGQVEAVRDSLWGQGFALISVSGLDNFLDDVEGIAIAYIDVLQDVEVQGVEDSRIDNALDALEEIALDPTAERETRVDAALAVLTVYDLYN